MSGTTTFNSAAVVQTYTISTTGIYDITAFGAQGGAGFHGGLGGDGAEIGGDFNLTAGEVLDIVVGGAGVNGKTAGGYGAGGGGAGGSVDNGTSVVAMAGERAGAGLVSITRVACYLAGTRILTDRGEAPVEQLAVGDLVVTAAGERRAIKWIGQRGYSARFVRSNPDLRPVGFKAGSIADNVPSRDLWVSPRHAMFLEGALIEAERLVNGVTVVRPEKPEETRYLHIELDSHDVLLAEGAPSESFIDDNSRGMFHNAHSFAEMYPETVWTEAVYCAPRVGSGHALEAARRRLDRRAGLSLPPERRFGALRGRVDGCDGRMAWGWAQDMAYPDAPVCLEAVVDGKPAGLILAERFRPDLSAAGIGDGHHAFSLTLSHPVSPDMSHTVIVRRASDGAVLSRAGRVGSQTMAVG